MRHVQRVNLCRYYVVAKIVSDNFVRPCWEQLKFQATSEGSVPRAKMNTYTAAQQHLLGVNPSFSDPFTRISAANIARSTTLVTKLSRIVPSYWMPGFCDPSSCSVIRRPLLSQDLLLHPIGRECPGVTHSPAGRDDDPKLGFCSHNCR